MSSKLVTIIGDAIKNKKTIIDIASKLHITPSQASNYIGQIAEKSPKLSLVFDKYHWPRNVNTGYIFLGDLHKQYGETKGRLVVGQHIMAEVLKSKDKAKRDKFYEIFSAVKIVKREYLVRNIFLKKVEGQVKAKKTYGEIKGSIWIPIDEELSSEENKALAKEYGGQILQPLQNTKIAYVAGGWLGLVEKHAIVSVNHKF